MIGPPVGVESSEKRAGLAEVGMRDHPRTIGDVMSSLTRRHFLTTTTGAGLAGILAAGVPPARGQQREISYLCWNNFAPLSDKKLAEIGPRFTKDTGIKIKIDHIAAPQQAAKYASEVQTQAGHDLVEMRMHVPWLYEPQLVDVSDIVTNLEKSYGKVIPSGYEAAHVKGIWRAVPQYHSIFVSAYREDLFKKAGLAQPKTWEDLYKVGLELKKMGHPVGIPISQNFDSISTGSAVMWCHGAMEVDKDGKTVKINSEQTAQVVEWYKKMYRDCMEPEVLSWTDASNNESLQQGKAGWIHNRSASGSSRRTSSPRRNGSATCSPRRKSTTSTSCPAARSCYRSTRRSRTTRSSRPIRSWRPSRARGRTITPTAGRRRPPTRCS